MKKLQAGILGLLVMGMMTISFASDSPLIQFEDAYTYSSVKLFEKATALVALYPELLELEILGASEDGNPIYVIRMSADIQDVSDTAYVDKMHLLIDAGVHSRETFNPVATLKMLEDYCMDYYNNVHLSGYDVKALLNKHVLHVVPLANPDGFDLVKFGVKSINTPSLSEGFLKFVNLSRLNRLKSNVNGVDINRNFEDVYYDSQNKVWVDQWSIHGSDAPSLEGFGGPSAGSETETQILMTYMKAYDFRAYLSFHSMGQVVFYNIKHLGDDYLQTNTAYANRASALTGYKLMDYYDEGDNGFSTHYFANLTLKPALTIETTSSLTFPTPLKNYYTDYYANRLWTLPLEFMILTREMGYSAYKVYQEDTYVRDFDTLSHAQAFADQIAGEVHVYEGKPAYKLSRNATVTIGTDDVYTRSVIASDGRIYMEFKEVLEKMSYKIIWFEGLKQVYATNENSEIRVSLVTLRIHLTKDGVKQEIVSSNLPFVYQGRLMIPIDILQVLSGAEDVEVTVQRTNQYVYYDF